MTNECRGSNDKKRQVHIHYYFGLRNLIIPSSFFSFVNDEFVPVRVSKLRHPANRRLGLFNIERDSTFFQLRDGRLDVIDFESDRCPITRRFPRRMTTNSDSDWAKIIFDPGAVHLSRTWFELEHLLIKFSGAFFVRNCYGHEGHFVCDHLQTPFSFSGLSL